VPGTRPGWKGRGGVILNASGCLDALTAPDVARELDAFVTKTVTPLPREGNGPVRIAETETGMLNSIGLANPGIDRFRTDVLPRLAELRIPIWVSVGGFCAHDYADLCAQLDSEPTVDTIELNVSCPNVAAADEAAHEIVTAARAATRKPLYAKLSPSLPDVAAAAVAAAEAGADGLSLVNTLRGLSLDARTLRPTLATATGGLSGPALRSVALAAVYACYRATALPIVGMGGVESGRHALELVAAGASAVALGTVLFADPGAPGRIRAELEAEATRQGFPSAFAARGCAHDSVVNLANKRQEMRPLSNLKV
jgi:dihydroorotate dehydrogenase (NAD+) catalytic subunit